MGDRGHSSDIVAAKIDVEVEVMHADMERCAAAEKELTEKRTAAEKRAPDSLRYPITSELMQDPVMVASGHKYERTAIEFWFMENNTDPKTNVQFTSKLLVPNHNLRVSIEEFVSQLQPDLPVS